YNTPTPRFGSAILRLGSTRDLDLQSASRSILSSSRWSFSALPVAAAVLALASAAFGQSSTAVPTTTTLTTAPASDASGKTILTVHVSPAPQSAAAGGSVTFEETDSSG